MAPSKLPVGLKLTGNHKVGLLIGEGAFGHVHLVDSGEKRKVWASKVVPVPTKTTSKQNSPQEVACARLWSEYMLYNSQFPSLCGTILPRLPSRMKDGLEFYFENNRGTRFELLMFASLLTIRTGYRCIIMEKMECLFFDGIQPLVQSSRGETKIPLNKIACKLMDILEAIHTKNHILVDIKPDNLMLATLSGKVTDESIAKSLRLVDLGLVASFRSTGHRDDEGIANIQGTPLYAGLHVHELHTPSRRDDVEAMLYVIAELVLMVHGILQRSDPPYKQQSFLPWMEGGSDAAIYNIKKRCVEDLKSEFYTAMPKDAARILHMLIGSAQAMTYKKKPDYELFRDALKTLHVPVPPKSATRKSKSSGKRGSGTPVSLSAQKTRTAPAKRSAKKAPAPKEVIEIDDDDDEYNSDVSMEILSSDEEMFSCEEEEQEDAKVAAVCQGPSSKSGSIQLVGLEHPIVLSKGQKIVVGSDPQEKGDTLLIEDWDLRSSHVRFSKGHLKNTVQVTPIARSLVQVAGNKVPTTGTLAFLNQTVKFGAQSVIVQKVHASISSTETETVLEENKVPGKNSKRMTRSARSAQGNEEDVDADAYIIITTGSQKGEYFAFTKDQPSMVIGSAPTSRKGFHVVLEDGEGVDADHVHLQLSVRRGVVSCTVRDLNSRTGTFLNRDQITSGAAFCGSSVITIGNVAMELVSKIP